MTGPYNKKSPGALRRLSFLKILLVNVKKDLNLRKTNGIFVRQNLKNKHYY